MMNVDSTSAVTFVTDATSFYRNPSTVANTSEATAKIELQLQFLAKELELERYKREKLQKEVENMTLMLSEQHKQSKHEVQTI
jgi:hypothetical protein